MSLRQYPHRVFKNWTGKFGDTWVSRVAIFFTVINRMKYVKYVVWQLLPHLKYVAAIPCENKTLEIYANFVRQYDKTKQQFCQLIKI